MQRIFLALCLSWMGCLPAEAALPPLTFAQFCNQTSGSLDPYITDYFKRYPEQKGSEPIVRKFFQEHEPVVLMAELKKDTPLFYAGVKTKAEAAQSGKKKSNYSLDDFLKLPQSEQRDLANLVGPYLHALLTDEDSKKGIQDLVHKEGRALEVAFMLVQMRAQQSTAQAFSEDLGQIMGGLSQMRQASAPAQGN